MTRLIGPVTVVAGLAALGYLSTLLAPGELVLATVALGSVLAVVARQTLRRLFGPVFAYELTRLGRRRATFTWRFVFVALVGVVLVFQYGVWLGERNFDTSLTQRGTSPLSQFALEFFIAYSFSFFFFLFLVAPILVSGSVVQEKERKTLEFLLATDLSPSEIIFGKVAARVILLLQFVVAGLGVMIFLQMFGGVDPDLLLASTAVSVATAVGVSSFAIHHSVKARTPRGAITRSLAGVIVYLVVSYILLGVSIGLLPGLAVSVPAIMLGGVVIPLGDFYWALGTALDAFTQGNPLTHLTRIGRAGFDMKLVSQALRNYSIFWGVLSAYWLGYSVLRLRAIALAQPEVSARRHARAARRRPPLGDRPVFWKEVFVDGSRMGPIRRAMLWTLVYLFPVGLLVWFYAQDFQDVQDYFDTVPVDYVKRVKLANEFVNVWVRAVTTIGGFICFIAVAVRGASAVATEQDRDTWVTLSTVPLTPWQLARDKWWGAVLSARQLYYILGSVWVVGLALGAVQPLLMLLVVAMFFVYASTFAWMGVWCSARARSTFNASVRAFLYALILLGGFFVFMIPVFAVLETWRARGVEQALVSFLATQVPVVTLPTLLMGPDERLYEIAYYNPFYTPFGPVHLLTGVLTWLGLCWMIARHAHRRFAAALNRTPGATSASSRPPM